MSQDNDVAVKELLAGLRAALDSDAERAGRRFVLLRRKLVSFFEWGGAMSPDACADETLVAAAWKLTDGEAVQSVPACCVAIARTMLQKHKQEQARDESLPAGDGAAKSPTPDPFGDLDALVYAFETGFDALPPESQDLLLTYYAGEQPQAIEARHALARRLNLPLNQLRIRAHRMRSQLEQAVMGPAAPSPGEAR